MEYTKSNAFSGGVDFGGLKNDKEIKVLICYILHSIKSPITAPQLYEAVISQELVNYFELSNALEKNIKADLVSEDENGFLSITKAGQEVASELDYLLPYTVAQKAIKSTISLLQYDTLKKEHLTNIKKTENGSFILECSIETKDFTAFQMNINMPSEAMAKLAKEKFILNAQDIYKMVLGVIIDEPKMYREFLED